MRRASALSEVFVLWFEEEMERYRKRRLTAAEAGEVLGMSGRRNAVPVGLWVQIGSKPIRVRLMFFVGLW